MLHLTDFYKNEIYVTNNFSDSAVACSEHISREGLVCWIPIETLDVTTKVSLSSQQKSKIQKSASSYLQTAKEEQTALIKKVGVIFKKVKSGVRPSEVKKLIVKYSSRAEKSGKLATKIQDIISKSTSKKNSEILVNIDAVLLKEDTKFRNCFYDKNVEFFEDHINDLFDDCGIIPFRPFDKSKKLFDDSDNTKIIQQFFKKAIEDIQELRQVLPLDELESLKSTHGALDLKIASFGIGDRFSNKKTTQVKDFPFGYFKNSIGWVPKYRDGRHGIIPYKKAAIKNLTDVSSEEVSALLKMYKDHFFEKTSDRRCVSHINRELQGGICAGEAVAALIAATTNICPTQIWNNLSLDAALMFQILELLKTKFDSVDNGCDSESESKNKYTPERLRDLSKQLEDVGDSELEKICENLNQLYEKKEGISQQGTKLAIEFMDMLHIRFEIFESAEKAFGELQQLLRVDNSISKQEEDVGKEIAKIKQKYDIAIPLEEINDRIDRVELALIKQFGLICTMELDLVTLMCVSDQTLNNKVKEVLAYTKSESVQSSESLSDSDSEIDEAVQVSSNNRAKNLIKLYMNYPSTHAIQLGMRGEKDAHAVLVLPHHKLYFDPNLGFLKYNDLEALFKDVWDCVQKTSDAGVVGIEFRVFEKKQ